MNSTLKPVSLFEDIAQSSTTGQIEIIKNSVVWQLFLVQGKIESATHSLQSAQTIKYYLRIIGYDDIGKIDFLNDNNYYYNTLPVKHLIHRLEKREHINSQQKNLLTKKITEDALEPLFWISKHEGELIPNKEIKPLSFDKNQTIDENNLLEIQSLINNVHNRLQLWQKLNQFIVSPHQRPYCVNSSRLEQSTSLGTLSIKVLKQLVKLMQGLSIRELAFLVRQDELKLAQLLSSYIKHNVLQLHPPKSPLDLLPLIPPPISKESLVNQLDTNKIKTQDFNPTQKKYTIVCIDDSPAMLEIIKSYLDADNYNLITIEDPMKSLSSMFKSNPDLILMDISMPGINGNRLCQILKSSSVFKSVPIILISGETKILNQEILQSTGAKDFLAKPFTKESLLNIIQKYG